MIKIQAWDTPFYARYRSFVHSYLRRSKVRNLTVNDNLYMYRSFVHFYLRRSKVR